jgi:hypothetical protein
LWGFVGLIDWGTAAAVCGGRLSYQQLDEGWLARKGRFVGVGPTRRAALADLTRKIWLHFAPAGTEGTITGVWPDDGQDEPPGQRGE